MQPTPTELKRLIDNLIRIGTVAAVRSGECRVKTGDITTNWRPYTAERAGANRTRQRLSLGEQVILLSVSGDLRNTYLVGRLNADKFPEPLAEDDNPDLDRTEYADGAVIEYNPATGALNATGIKSANIEASVTIKLITPLVECTKALKVGTTISATDHIIQSVRDILITPVGSRVMRRDYGSELFYLIDMPQHQATRLRLMAATVQALINWEPRITITRVDVLGGGMDGALTIELTWQRKDGGVLESATIPIPTGAAQ